MYVIWVFQNCNGFWQLLSYGASFSFIIISLVSALLQFEMEGGNHIRCDRIYLGDCTIGSPDQIAKLKF
jgi:hypothetical protein